MAKKKAEKTVEIKVYEPYEPPHEGAHYELIVWKKPEFAFTSLPGATWYLVKQAADVLELVDEFDRQSEVFAKVQIRRVTREVIVGA